MELNKLSKDELINLKNEVETELQKVIKKENFENQVKANNGSILNLKNGDAIFGIKLSFGGHSLNNLQVCVGEIDTVDYCIIENIDLKGNSDEFKLDISHPSGGFGVYTAFYKRDYVNEHCLLFMKDSESGYDSFYTLKPKSWKEDLIRLYHKKIEYVKFQQQKELSLYDNKLNIFLEAEDKINQQVLSLCQ